MILRKGIAATAAALLVFTCIKFPALTGSADTGVQPEQPLSFSSGTESENQLWRFEPADDSVSPEYYLQNVDSRQYLMIEGGELTAGTVNEQNVPAVFSVSGDKNGYTIGCQSMYLNAENGLAVLGVEKTVFEVISFDSAQASSLQPAGTYGIRIKGSASFLTDASDSYYTLSSNADVYSSAATQKWHIDTAEIINGEQYYTFVSLDSNRYVSSDGENAVLRYLKDSSASLWRVTEISYQDIPSDCGMNDMYNHYYRITNALGQILYVDGETGAFRLSSDIALGPSSIFVFEEGGEFSNSGTFHIANIGGRGGSSDVYDETCRRFLQSVRDGYELSVSLQPANKQVNQKWEITYVSSEDRPGNWYRFHYYTIKSVEFDLYLTVENGGFVLAERDEENDYQLWNFFDMNWGWITTQSGSDGKYLNYYCVTNKGTGTAMSSVSSRLSLQELRTDIIGGDAGASWLLNGTMLDLGHAEGNNDASKLVKSIEVSMLCYSTGLYLEADGPDIPVPGSIEELYISLDGDDSNTGESADKPIKTVERALELISEKTIAKRGKILFRRGDTFIGNLELTKITGRTGKYIYFEDYGDPDKPNPVICSNSDMPAAILSECYCVSLRNIDFTAPMSLTGVVEINDSLMITYENSSVSGDKNVTENGIIFSSSGDIYDSENGSVTLDNISVIGCKTGINFMNSGGFYITDSQVGQTSGSGMIFTDCDNISLDSVKVYDTSENGEGAVRITSSGLIFSDITVERTYSGNGIQFTGIEDAASEVTVSDSTFAYIAGVGISVSACDKQTVDGTAVVATDSLVIDNVIFIGNESYDINYENTREDSSNLASYIGNSTFVRDDGAYYEEYPDGIMGVIQNNNTFFTSGEYAEMRSDYREFIKSALTKKKGTTSDTVWESFQSTLVEAIEVYNRNYVTKYTLDSMISSVETAMSELTYNTSAGEGNNQETVTEDIEVTIEQAVTEMIRALSESDDDTISLRVSEDFVLTVDMQKIVTEAAKKLKITFTDENEEMLYQWSFEILPCLYDIVLKVENEPLYASYDLTSGQIISVRHEGELPAGTKLIVKNQKFTERVNLMLKYYSQNDNAFIEAGTGIGEKTVLMSNDNGYLQLTISRGGDFAAEIDDSSGSGSRESVDTPEENDSLTFIFITIGCVLLTASAAAAILLSIKRRRRKKSA